MEEHIIGERPSDFYTRESSTGSVRNKLGWEDYAVFAVVLLMSSGIGIFYGIIKRKQQSKEEFLMGSRQMSALPVSLSLMCSFISAIAILGNPMEVYSWGTMYMTILISFIPMTIVLYYIYVPVYFKMQLTSSFEYLEIRFNSSVRYLVSVINIVYLIIYMSLVVYGPSLALNQVTGFNTTLSVAMIFIVCIFYSSIGGFRAVLMTDALQGVIMIGSILAIDIKGFSDLGFSSIWEKAQATERVVFFRFDTDVRTRHTVWSVVFGGFFLYLNFFAGTQANIQRYSSMPNLKTAKRAVLYNYVVLTLMMGSILCTGLILVGQYFYCDPFAAKLVKSSDQTIPFLVMDILGEYPGVPGVFVAGITCASLSTVSSGLNAMAAVITEDYIRKIRPNLSDAVLLKLSRLISVVAGVVSFCFVFVVQNMGNIYPVAISLSGMVMGPTTGVFTLGMLFPWATSWGAFGGTLTSFILTGLLTIGSSIAGMNKQLPDQTLSVSTENCTKYMTLEEMENIKMVNHSYAPGFDWKERHEEDSTYLKFMSTSYMLFPAIAVCTTIVTGLAYSFILRALGLDKGRQVEERCFNSHFLKFWRWLFPNEVKALVMDEEESNK